MIAARHHAHTAQADVALAAVPGHILRVLRLVGLDQILAPTPTAKPPHSLDPGEWRTLRRYLR
ncbi:hypothetical protein [Streptomyces mutabilis]|uniref:hypothetical protein n=1 Tax=Streptomyces TaxID=1883 RepID=UPI0039879901